MTKKDLVTLFKSLHGVQSLRGAKFGYAIAKNISLIKPEIEALDKAQEKSEEFKKLEEEFEPTRIQIAEKHANKDADGKAIKKLIQIEGQSLEVYDIPDNKASNEECEEKMKSINPEVYEARVKQVKDYQELLKEEINIAFFPYVIKLSDVPEEALGAQMKMLYDSGIVIEQ